MDNFDLNKYLYNNPLLKEVKVNDPNITAIPNVYKAFLEYLKVDSIKNCPYTLETADVGQFLYDYAKEKGFELNDDLYDKLMDELEEYINKVENLYEIKVNDPSIGKYKIQYNGTGGGFIRDEIEKLGGKITDSKIISNLNHEAIIYFIINSSLIPQLQKSRSIEGWKIEKDNEQ